MAQPKPVFWVGNSRDEIRKLPSAVQDVFGYALYLAQLGLKYHSTKPLKGFGSAGVLEVVEDFDGDTYRAVYTVKFTDAVYVLHVFQKKAKRGSETPKLVKELIKQRFKLAEADHQKRKRV